MDNVLITLPFLLLLLQLIPTCSTTSSSSLGHDLCNTISSCGDIRNIRYPFRLTTDPINCGNSHFQISCDNNVPIFIYNRSERYYVRSINYNNYIIRLSDASLVPLPNNNTFSCNHSHSVDRYTIGHGILSHYSQTVLNFLAIYYGELPDYTLLVMSCPSPLAINRESCKWINYTDGAPCNSSGEHARYWYAAVADTQYLNAQVLEDSCQVELMLRTSKPPDISKENVSISFHDVLESWSYGLELSWFYWFCYNSSSSSSAPTTLCRLEFAPVSGEVLLDFVLSLYVMLRATFLIIGAPLFIALLVYKWRRRHISSYDNIEHLLESTYDQLMPVRYSYADIKRITNGFKRKLGQGGYGSVYKGKLRSGQVAAVKMLDKTDTDGKDFINEISTIGRVHHFNVVRLIGVCAEGSKRALVYPFMPNGSLEKYIFPTDERDMNIMPTITDEKMYEIALGVARGIEYLHRGCHMQILHFDIKPHNILLDENFVPKVADFGLARLYPTNKNIVSLTAVKGTLGYMAPEFFYRSIGGISYKADVYSYGRMLIEMATRKKDPSSPAVNSSQIFLPSWVHDQFSQGNDIWIEEDNTREEKEIRKKMMMVGLWCVQLSPTDRPSMHKVVQMLQGRLDTLLLPPKPSFAPPFLPMNVEDSSAEITDASRDTHTSSLYINCGSAIAEDEAVLVQSQASVA